MRARADAYTISIPATSANLGPGFDAVGVALTLRISARVHASSCFRLGFADEGEPPSHEGFGHAIIRAMRCVDDRLPSVRVLVRNAIPLGKGLGSSAAASVLGLAIAWRASGRRFDAKRIAQLASEIEEHPDNALAAVFGGAVIAGSSEANRYMRLQCAQGIRPVLVIPQVDLPTQQARALLPDEYSRRDVIFNVQRAAMLGAALASGDWRALGEAMHDRVHQPYRAAAIPGMADALQVCARDLAGVALSGAGPSIIALVRSNAPWQRIAHRIAACFKKAGIASRSLALEFSPSGVLWKSA